MLSVESSLSALNQKYDTLSIELSKLKDEMITAAAAPISQGVEDIKTALSSGLSKLGKLIPSNFSKTSKDLSTKVGEAITTSAPVPSKMDALQSSLTSFAKEVSKAITDAGFQADIKSIKEYQLGHVSALIRLEDQLEIFEKILKDVIRELLLRSKGNVGVYPTHKTDSSSVVGEKNTMYFVELPVSDTACEKYDHGASVEVKEKETDAKINMKQGEQLNRKRKKVEFNDTTKDEQTELQEAASQMNKKRKTILKVESSFEEDEFMDSDEVLKRESEKLKIRVKELQMALNAQKSKEQ